MALSRERIDALIEREGGDKYTDLPADRGGPTRWGITQTTARAFGYVGEMRDLARSTAEAIYLQRYWTGPRFADIDPISYPLAGKLWDIGVNMGPGVAATFLQRALNVLNRQGADYPDIEADGRIGPMTLHALRALLAKRGKEGETELVNMVDAQQRVRYMEISERDHTQETFSFGWQRRASYA
jgi:lysozyme family protein